MATKKYISRAREMARARSGCKHWIDKWSRKVHTVTGDTKEELEGKKKEVEEKIKKLSYNTFTVYLKEWEDGRY